jgi:hypothetical protein
MPCRAPDSRVFTIEKLRILSRDDHEYGGGDAKTLRCAFLTPPAFDPATSVRQTATTTSIQI